MALEIQNWEKQLAKKTSDPDVKIRYIQLSAVHEYGLFVSSIPPGEANTGHFHPQAAEKYHIAKGRGSMLSLPATDLESKVSPVRQEVREGMSIHIPGLVVHRLVNDGPEDLVFFFECPLSHMDVEDPVRTIVEDFGGQFPRQLKDCVSNALPFPKERA